MSGWDLLAGSFDKSTALDLRAAGVLTLLPPDSETVVVSSQRRSIAADANGNLILHSALTDDATLAYSTDYAASFVGEEGNFASCRLIKYLDDGFFHNFHTSDSGSLRYGKCIPGDQGGTAFNANLGSGGFWATEINDIVLVNGIYTVFLVDNIGTNRLRTFRGSSITLGTITQVANATDNTRIVEAVVNSDGVIVGRGAQFKPSFYKVVDGAITNTYNGYSGGGVGGFGTGQNLFVRGKRFFFCSDTHIVFSDDGINWSEYAYTYEGATPSGTIGIFIGGGQYDIMTKGNTVMRKPVGGTVWQTIGTTSGGFDNGSRAIFQYPFVYLLGIGFGNPVVWRIQI